MGVTEAQPADRRISFEGCWNFRDLGGYPSGLGGRVRWGRVFRADGITRLTDDDLERFAALGIATVIDLRGHEEVATRGRFPHAEQGVGYHHLPLVDVVPDMSTFPDADSAGPAFVADRYHEMVAEGGDRLARALTVLADAGSLPAVFHCSAGKDRTGILAAIVLRLLGVAQAEVVADYALSDAAMKQMLAQVADRSPEARDVLRRYPSAMLGAHPDNMVRFLGELERVHGSVAGYVASLGVDATVPERLRAELLGS